MCELESVVPVDVDAGQRDELVLVAERRQVVLELGDLLVVEILLPVERRRAVVAQQLARVLGEHGLREFARETDVRHARLTPDEVSVRCVGNTPRDRLLTAARKSTRLN